MMKAESQTFAELVGFDPSALGAGTSESHGTTVIALRFDKGVIVMADRRATMGNLIMYDQAEKIEALDDSTLVAISGAYGRSIEVCRYLVHAFKYYERMNLVEISTEGKLMEISRALAGNLPMAMQGIGLFVPIAATFDKKAREFGIWFFDTAGAKFSSTSYAAAGSGSERIRGIFDYISRTKKNWVDRKRDDVLVEGLTMLDIAADLDSATGGFRKTMPSISILTADGIHVMTDDEIRPFAQEVIQESVEPPKK